jgi:hypothetical protein
MVGGETEGTPQQATDHKHIPKVELPIHMGFLYHSKATIGNIETLAHKKVTSALMQPQISNPQDPLHCQSLQKLSIYHCEGQMPLLV